ncbi:LysR substrate-binding domain-containing protein [Burkholderia cenocepacia]|nr:LysR substrate-binding domain-containing protein [Burkholderia cenocepacia]MDR5646014.1 LysR substrate-binding domain-containing protein [Burkholderia cenocepacia]MDS0806088.1 LysR substrate-binding domain-containing protein [Burkholderia cenocepacia]
MPCRWAASNANARRPPGYVEKYGAPGQELTPYRWEFVEDGCPFDVAVEPQLTTNDLRLMLRLALAGAGITFAPEDCLRAHFDDGSLVPLLEAFLPPFSGFFLCFPQRRNMVPKLRALIDYVRQWQAPSAACG